MVRFDRSWLPPAEIEFVVIADTHHIVDPYMYPADGDSVNPDLVRDWAGRGDVALAWAKALDVPLVFHVGDLQQEYPGHAEFDVGRRAALEQMRGAGLTIHHAAGNMDIGDKSDPTMPAGWVEQRWLDVWHEDFGPSHFAVDEGRFHFIILNSQVLNSDLPEGRAQHHWLEADLAASEGRRIFIFLHIPPFLVDADEPGLGSYDVLDEPDRSWLLGLARRYRIEAVFAGHTHFQTFNAVDDTRLYTAPSTTTTRPGFPEALSVEPPLRGWGDSAKLGFFLVRALERGSAVHRIRTSGRATDDEDGDVIVTRVSRELSSSPVGAYLRLPLARDSAGAIAYPYEVRHRIRDDYPLLACTELGLGHVRFPVEDLDVPLQADRLQLLRSEGVALTGSVIHAQGRPVPDPNAGSERVDLLEIRLAGRTIPNDDVVAMIGARGSSGPGIALSPILMESSGTVHKRSRSGYRAAEVTELDAELRARGLTVERAVCWVDPERTAWDGVRAFADLDLRAIGGLDLLIPVGAGEPALLALAERIVAAATIPGARVIIDPLQELDRTATVMAGLLDRLSNPTPAFDLVRTLTTMLHAADRESPWTAMIADSAPGLVERGVTADGEELWLVDEAAHSGTIETLLSRHGAERPLKLVDLVAGRSWTVPSAGALAMSDGWRTRSPLLVQVAGRRS